MIFQRTVAGSEDVDIVYGPGDSLRPAIMNLDDLKEVNLTLTIRNSKGKILEEKIFKNVRLPEGRTVTYLPAYQPGITTEGYYFIEYKVDSSKQ
jgi:hypothetical protein